MSPPAEAFVETMNLQGRLTAAERALEAAERRADDAESLLRETIEAIPSGIVVLDAERRFVLWNERYADFYRESAEFLQKGWRLDDMLVAGMARGAYPDAVGREREWLAERVARLENPAGAHEQQLVDGRCLMIDERRTKEGGTIGIRVDITDMKRREASFRALFEDNPMPMLVFDLETGSVAAANGAARRLYDYQAGEMIGMDCRSFMAEEDGLPATGSGSLERTVQHRRSDGSVFDAAVMSRDLDHGGRPAVLLSVVDMTSRKQAEDRVAYMARHDALTDLPNRIFYRERVDALLARSGEVGFALLLVDLDEFKSVNDTLGHQMGDMLLRAVADRLRGAIGAKEFVARLGGDEFAIVLAGVTSREEIQAFAHRVLASVSRSYVIEGNAFFIGASVGVAVSPNDADVATRLLKCADLALYRAKAEGNGLVRFFENDMDAAWRKRRELEFDLRRAIASEALEVRYQPLVNLRSGRITGFEALARWTHPERGAVSPAVFIAIAEEIGVIDQLSEVVLRRACVDANRWPNDVRLAVNLSPMQFRTGNVLPIVFTALERSGLDPARLEIEITESLVIEDSESTLATLHELRSRGVGIAMDDFGTGYSSLSSLRSFPFSKIKIDQTFVHGLSARADSQAIVRAIVGLGRSLNMAVTAEGVEEQDDIALLLAEGCAEAQGYFFSPAQPIDETLELLRGNRDALEAVSRFIADRSQRGTDEVPVKRPRSARAGGR